MFNKTESAGSKLEMASFILLIATILVLPIAIGLSVTIAPVYTKIALGSTLLLLSLVAYAASRMSEQSVSVPRSRLLLVAWTVPLVYLLSTLFAVGGTESFFGEQLMVDSGSFIATAMLALTLVALVVSTQKRALGMYLALLLSAVVLSVAELAIFFARESVLGMVPLPTLSLLGSLNDLAVFFGLIVIFVLLALVMLPVAPVARGVLWLSLALSGLFLSIVNLKVLWWIVGFYALGCFVYAMSAPYLSKGNEKRTSVSLAALAMLVLAGTYLFGPASLTGIPAQWANVGELDVRPSWRVTVELGSEMLKEHALFGMGPGSFSKLWAVHMPPEINATEFWQTDFQYGIGLIPTSIITTGVVGIVAWLLFLGALLFYGIRSLIIARHMSKSPSVQFFRVSSFMGALYLWTIAFIQVPSPALVLYACILTGLFIASSALGGDQIDVYTLRFADNPRIGFVVALFLTVLVLVSCGALYSVGTRYMGEVSYQRAILAINTAGDLDLAQTHLEKAIHLHPVDVYYRVLSNIDLVRMQRLVSQNKPPEEIVNPLQELMARSIGNAVKATELDSTDYQNWLNLGSLYQSIAPLGIEGSLDSAQAAFDRVLELRPHSPIVFYAKAGMARQRGDAEASRSLVEQAISERNQFTDAIFLLAQLQLEQNDVQSAIDSVRAVTVFEPNNPVPLFQLGLLYYGSNQFVEAVRALEAAVKVNPVYANARYFLGLSYWRLGNTKAAIEQFKKVYETNQDNPEVQAIIANLEAGKQPFEPSTPIQDINARTSLPLTEGESTGAADTSGGTVAPEQVKELAQ